MYEGKPEGLPKHAVETMVGLQELVSYWDGDRREHGESVKMWGKLLASQSLDLGLRAVWEMLPQKGEPMGMAQMSQLLAMLERRGVNLGYAFFVIGLNGQADVQLCVPRAFPDFGIAPIPDPSKISLLG